MAAASASDPKPSAFLFLLLLLLLLLLLVPLVSSLAEDPAALLDRHAAQLDHLQTLIESLSKTVSTLDSTVSSLLTDPKRLDPRPSTPQTRPTDLPLSGAAASVTKNKPSWSERFQFSAAARLESDAAFAAVLPYVGPDGLTKFFAAGDTRGRVYIFSSSSGDVIIELPAISDSPTTTILCYLSSGKNQSLLFTGHEDGSIAAHRVWESTTNRDDWLTLSLASSQPFVRGTPDSASVSGLDLYQVGRARYIIASDSSGRIRVFTEDGTLYGTAIAASRPLAFVKQRLLFLTETGAGSLDLRSMAVRETDCDGLNGSVVKRYSFDGSERTKAYGFTAGGDLIHVILLGDTANLKCRVRSIRRSEIDIPVSIQTLRGYLLVGSQDKVSVYNISSQYYGRVGAPRPLFSVTLQEIKSLFLNYEAPPSELSVWRPVIAVDREKLAILGLGGGYIGVYRPNFPVFKVESNAVVWSAPALFFLLFFIGIWQFYVKKKDALGWTPDESFNVPGTSSAGLLGPSPGERPRAADLRERRGGALRGPLQRYPSPPSRYPGGPGIPYRPSAEPSYRETTDLKFRGQNMDNLGLPKRREQLFQNTQVVEDHVD